MSNSLFIAATMYVAWLISPEALVLVSNLAGIGGLFAGATLLLAAALTILAITLIKGGCHQIQPANASHFFSQSCKLASTVALVVFISTGILVTAGFTFNETFLYWFPNFGFSTILLSTILLIHMIGDRAIVLAQKVFSSVTLLCLLVIIMTGLFTGNSSDLLIIPNAPQSLGSQTLALTGGSLLLFLGAYQTHPGKLSTMQFIILISTGALLLFLWQLIALKHVAADTLAESTIPYIIVAREVLGQTGRFLMGIVIISGTCAAVNSFFTMATITCSNFITRSLFSTTLRINHMRRLLSLVFSLTIGTCMATGLAGEPHLDIYIYGALLLWLLSICAQILIKALQYNYIPHKIVTAIFFIAFLYLTMAHDESSSLVMFLILALCPSLMLTSAGLLLGKKCNQPQSQ